MLPASASMLRPGKMLSTQMTVLVSTYGFREETVDVSGVSIHCVIKEPEPVADVADASGSVVNHNDDVFVFVHGTASASIIFFEVMKRIPANVKCIAIDLPNFGISGSINTDKHENNEDYIRCYADIIGNTLIKLNILKNTILVAHSLGGFISIYTAERYPIKKLVLLNPAGILPTLGVYGYYWGMFFKAGLPTTLFRIHMISCELWIHLCHLIFGYNNSQDKITDFWLSFFMNNENTGHEILQRLITLRPFYSYWNTPAIMTLLDVYKKVPTHICFGEDDTIIPSHIGEFLNHLTDGEIMIHNIKNASHNPCCNIECFLKYISSIMTGDNISDNKTVVLNKSKRIFIHDKTQLYRGYSYHSLQDTTNSFRTLYSILLKHIAYCPPHSE